MPKSKPTKPRNRKKSKKQKITTLLTFERRAEEAMKFYVSTLKNSRILNITRSDGKGPVPKGHLLGATFELDGHQFLALDGGAHFSFAPGISLS